VTGEPHDRAVVDVHARRAHAREALAHLVGRQLDARCALACFPRLHADRRVLEIDIHQLAEARHAETERGAERNARLR